jgi:hypothetical protein
MKARALALACFALFLGRTFHKAWNIDESDFPNYYTAAVLVRHGEPVGKYYDWTWFQRQMNFAGIEQQLGAYIPQTPLTMLPLVPMARFPAQTAKRIWLVLNLALLIGTVWLLSQVTSFRIEHIALLLFAGYGALQSNFHLGQYYVFLLFLLTLAFYCLQRQQSTASGFVAGMAFGLKLYGGPLLLYFLVRRNWKAAAGFAVVVLCCLATAIGMFGWNDVHYFATQILPRALQGEVIDPYNSGTETLTTLLRKLFVLEPELNPRPMWNAPLLFFFLRPFLSALILMITLLGLAGKHAGIERRDFAWFLIAALLLSANTASYTFILLLLPVSLLLVDAHLAERVFLIAAYFALCFPLRPGWSEVFPKLWVLIALFFVVGWNYFRVVSPKLLVAALVAAIILASVETRRQAVSYAAEPAQQFERIAVQKAAIFSGAPTVSAAGLFYQSIGRNRYVLRWLHDGVNEEVAFDGEAFGPEAPSPDGPIYFELVARGSSTWMAFEPATRRAIPAVLPISSAPTAPAELAGSATSPDGKWIAFETERSGPKQIWLRNVATGKDRQLTGGNCNSSSPAWELNSEAIVFASDCGRGIGLPALYRAKIESR